MHVGKVQGGTNAGWRTVREQKRVDWTCKNCDSRVRYYWTNCPNCSEPRPEED